jgi:hypothetical protein
VSPIYTRRALPAQWEKADPFEDNGTGLTHREFLGQF